ncbi:27767_t:CDS:1, partial [Dentiscutata erythropus]
NAVPSQLNKRATTFEPCHFIKDTLAVSITPDPPVKNQPDLFSVSGTLTNNNITAAQTNLIVVFIDLSNSTPIGDENTQPFNESYNAGIPFTINASIPIPAVDSYGILVFVGEELLTAYSCAHATVNGSAANFF